MKLSGRSLNVGVQLLLALSVVYLAAVELWDLLKASSPTVLIRTTISLVSVVLFLALIAAAVFLKRRMEHNTPPTRRTVFGWCIGFFTLLGVVSAIIFLVNPRGLYGARYFEPRLILTRVPKAYDYPKLAYNPDIVVLGSSRARTLSSAHSEKYTGYTLYNASLSDGSLEDSLVFARFMADQKTPLFPSVLLIEITPMKAIRANFRAAEWPAPIFPYMSSDMLINAVNERFKGLFSLAQLSEALHGVIIRFRHSSEMADWVFGEDGAGVAELASEEQLQSILDQDIKEDANEVWCDEVDSDFISYLEELVAIADTKESAVIFYMSPRQPRYYEMVMGNNESFLKCHAAYISYVDTLVEHQPNVFFLDYMRVESINGISTAQGFYDRHHITPANSDLLMKAAANTIREAYAVAEQTRKQG